MVHRAGGEIRLQLRINGKGIQVLIGTHVGTIHFPRLLVTIAVDRTIQRMHVGIAQILTHGKGVIERVEVMRGPTSVLYGNSNPGGIVSMVSKRPTTEPLKEVQFKMGTDNLWQTGFDFSDAIDDDGVWSYRLTGLGRSQDAQQQMAKSTRYAIAPSFSWRPDDKTDFTFLSNFQNDPDGGLLRLAAARRYRGAVLRCQR